MKKKRVRFFNIRVLHPSSGKRVSFVGQFVLDCGGDVTHRIARYRSIAASRLRAPTYSFSAESDTSSLQDCKKWCKDTSLLNFLPQFFLRNSGASKLLSSQYCWYQPQQASDLINRNDRGRRPRLNELRRWNLQHASAARANYKEVTNFISLGWSEMMDKWR